MSLRLRGVVLAATLLLGTLATAAPRAAPTVRRALVIAHNTSDDPSLPPLRYADDDGVLWTETLRRLGVETTLLVDADAETRQTDAAVLSGARPPTPDEVSRAVTALREAVQADRARGRQTDVLLVYVGHGNTDALGRAYFTLLGGRLDRSAFYTRLVDPLEADFVHVVVDACRASGVVGSRGKPDVEVLAELRGVLEREQLATRPHVGATFAESDSGETHEWSRLRAGVFSHVVRSGLMGGADVNGDGAVEYSELAAFVTASLQEVKAIPIRLSVHAYAPAREPRRPLVDAAPRGPSLVLPAGLEHARISVEDLAGRRLADVRRAEHQPVSLRLPVREAYWVRTPTAEARITLAQLGDGLPRLTPRELFERGPAEDALRRGLFAIAFDRSFYEQYVATSSFVPVDFSRTGGAALVERPPEPPPPLGLEAGLVTQRAPLGLAPFVTGPGVALRGAWAPFTLGLRAAYTFSPLMREGVSLQRLSVQGLLGLQGSGTVAPFLEAAGGWSLVRVSYPTATQGDPTVFSTQLSSGLVIRHERLRVRVAAFAGVDLVTADGGERADPTGGIEVTLGY